MIRARFFPSMQPLADGILSWDALPFGVLAVREPEGCIIGANKASAALFGYPSPDDLSGLFLSDLISDEEVPGPLPGPACTPVFIRAAGGPRPAALWSWRGAGRPGSNATLYVALAEEAARNGGEQELRKRLALQEMLTGLSLDFLASGTRPRLGGAFAALGRAMGVDRLFLCTFKGESGHLGGIFAWQAREIPAAGAPESVCEAWRAALWAGRPVVIPTTDDLPPAVREEQARRGVAALMLVPGAPFKGNRAMLVVEDCRGPRAWDRAEADAAGVFARLIPMAMDRWQEKELLRRQAWRDALTGLANRYAFERRLREIDGRPAFYPISLLIGDVDGLKAVNDRLGHQAGDRLLRIAGYVLRRVLRPDDTVARLGGDEFGVIMTATPMRTARTIQTRLQEVLSDYAGLGLRVSVGIATAAIPGQPLAPVLRLADRRMYEAKRSGGGGICVVP